MSVLNTVLQDLARRQGGALPGMPAHVTVVEPEEPRLPMRLILVALGGLLLLAIAATLWLTLSKNNSQPKPASATAPVPAAKPQAVKPQLATTPPASPAPAASTPTTVAPAPISQPPLPDLLPEADAIALAQDLASNQDNAEVFAAAQARCTAGDRSGCRSMLVKLLAQNPDHTGGVLLLARTWLEDGDLATAEHLMQQGIAYKPRSALVELLARLWVERGQDQQARALLLQYAHLASKNANYYTLLATLHQRAQQWDAASTNYRKALAIDPKHLRAKAGLGFALLAQGQTTAGEALLREVLPAADEKLRGAIEAGLQGKR